MSESGDRFAKDAGRQTRMAGEPQTRAVGAPLPIGGVRPPLPPEGDQTRDSRATAPPPGRALPSPAGPHPPATGLQRAMEALRMAMPLVQKIIPLIDGTVATTVSNFRSHPAAPPAPPASLARIASGMAGLAASQRDLREQVNEQNHSLRRVEDQLEMVREATDRNTLEQQELMEDLKAVGNKVNILALVLLALLVLSVAINIGLFLHLRRVLP
jgi:hypothetical protein